jgi:hypothetical protein
MWMFLPSLSIDDVSMIEMMAISQKLLFRPVLIEEGKHAEAVALMNTETWGIEEQGKPGEQETFIE